MLKSVIIFAAVLGAGTLTVSAASDPAKDDGKKGRGAPASPKAPSSGKEKKAEAGKKQSAPIALTRDPSNPKAAIAGYSPQTFHVGSLRWLDDPGSDNPLYKPDNNSGSASDTNDDD